MLKTIRFYNIEDKLFSITLDNEGANKSMMDLLRPNLLAKRMLPCDGDLFHTRCACHVLNLIVKDGLIEVDGAISDIRESVKYTRASQSRKEKFEEIIRDLGINCRSRPSLDVVTRWNSTCDMLESALPFKDVFYELKQQDPNYIYCPSLGDWQRAKVVCSLSSRKPQKLSGSLYPTSNLYFHEIWNVNQVLEKEKSSPNAIISAMVVEMEKKFEKYWKISYVTNCIPVILDPRFKLGFIEFRLNQAYGVEAGVHIAKVDKAIRNLFSWYSSQMGETSGSSTQDNDSEREGNSHSWSD
ncbi:LOW QUALITY PROTEIN: hypothetical protein U9M48_032051 [Paspalum notatum var. saurae]|uniref:hAT-like transposase RNase-H fold domain-containing protein n=1 Tax=Paspalum notatum var. saurae TaxID=547442 RepID=A0AAQ3U3W1_PASNO